MNFCVNSGLTGCLLVTHLPVKAELRRRPELAGRPLIISTAGPARPQALDASPEAAGVATGQSVAEALSRCAGAVTLPMDTAYLSEVNDRLLSALWDVVPAVEAAGWGVFQLDLTGMDGMYGGMVGLVEALLSVGEAWLRPRLGIGMGKFLAYCAAVWSEAGGWRQVPADAARWLEPLPASWLPLDGDALARLEGFGIRTLGDMARLPAAALAEFMGPDGIRAWRLAQGIDPDPVIPTPLPERLTERLEFPFPVDAVPAIEAGISSLSERLWRSASLRARCVGEATVQGELLSEGFWKFERVLRRPAGSADALTRSLLAGLGARDGGGGSRWPDVPLLDLALTVGALTPEIGRQATIWQRERVTNVGDVAGVERLAAMVPGSAMPERRWALSASLVPVNLPAKTSVESVSGAPRRVRTDGRHWRPVEQVVDLWEIETEWWTPQPVNRRYWRLALTDGGLLTVYRDLATGQWFRQGY
ncbi:MAG: DNA polymerase Y family protein [Deltaproteobacteria bacterium]|nr:DNA polymerase Y family protein [Deltaproteobacteria bacterium]